VWKAPVVFIVQNNQYGISTPFSMQTASDGIAIKALAYGIEGIQVDGNDFFAMYEAVQQSIEHIQSGKGPVLIEAVTYRKGAHTTSDDPTKYRTKEEELEWDKTDPLDRLRKYLIDKGLFSEEQEAKLIEEYKKEIDREFIEAENYKAYPLEDTFKYMYVEMLEDLKQQQVEHEKFLKWKEARQ
ncbi:MAG: pyruvate dehydrogenase (acetyl-transferring) E1 component subunit alpha, partial [Bacteroidales bacterium]|nr:pyruvate dehydrogenase (acetyl-transferring) E1 component subunit alpha [Bacteroidales bacterium]